MLKKKYNNYLKIALIILFTSNYSYAQNRVESIGNIDVDSLNNTASCDSTCSFLLDKEKTANQYNQKIDGCPTGYTGTTLQNNILQSNGQYTDWNIQQRNCVCEPSAIGAFTRVIDCAEPSKMIGVHSQEREWTCPTAQEGVYSAWRTTSNTCNYYKVSDNTRARTLSCLANQRGILEEKQTFELWSDSSERNVSAWITSINTCDYYLTTAGLARTKYVSCPTGQLGTHTQRQTYDLYSDGSERNVSAWVTISNSCYTPAPEFDSNSLSCMANGTCSSPVMNMPTNYSMSYSRICYEYRQDNNAPNYTCYNRSATVTANPITRKNIAGSRPIYSYVGMTNGTMKANQYAYGGCYGTRNLTYAKIHNGSYYFNLQLTTLSDESVIIVPMSRTNSLGAFYSFSDSVNNSPMVAGTMYYGFQCTR